MAKRNVLLLAAVSIVAMLAGCLSTEIVISLAPNPLVLAPDDTTVKARVTVKLSGIGTIRIDTITVRALGADGKAIINPETDEPYQAVFTVNKTVPAFGIAVDQEVDLPIDYELAEMYGLKEIQIEVSGSRQAVLKVGVQLAGK